VCDGGGGGWTAGGAAHAHVWACSSPPSKAVPVNFKKPSLFALLRPCSPPTTPSSRSITHTEQLQQSSAAVVSCSARNSTTDGPRSAQAVARDAGHHTRPGPAGPRGQAAAVPAVAAQVCMRAAPTRLLNGSGGPRDPDSPCMLLPCCTHPLLQVVAGLQPPQERRGGHGGRQPAV
jgi:hypothetical protein